MKDKPPELEIRPSARMRMAVLSLIALGAGIAMVLVFLLSGGGRQFFEHSTTLTAWMPDGTGLGKGSDVRLSGISIGQVTSVDMSGSADPQRTVRVEMKVNLRYLPSIPGDSETSISSDTLVGFKFMDIKEGRSPLPVSEGGELRSEPVTLASDRADQIQALQKELAQVDALMVQLTSPDTLIGHFFVGEEEYNTILARITAFDKSIHAVVNPTSEMGKALFSDAMYRGIRTKLATLDTTLSSLQKNTLLTSDAQYDQLVTQVKQLRTDLSKPRPLLTDDAPYRKLVKAMQDANALIDSLNEGNGKFAQYLNTDQTQAITKQLQGMEVFLKDFREHPQKYLRYQVFNKKKHAAAKATAANPEIPVTIETREFSSANQ